MIATFHTSSRKVAGMLLVGLICLSSIALGQVFDELRESRADLNKAVREKQRPTQTRINLSIQIREMLALEDCADWGHSPLINALTCRQAFVQAARGIFLLMN